MNKSNNGEFTCVPSQSIHSNKKINKSEFSCNGIFHLFHNKVNSIIALAFNLWPASVVSIEFDLKHLKGFLEASTLPRKKKKRKFACPSTVHDYIEFKTQYLLINETDESCDKNDAS